MLNQPPVPEFADAGYWYALSATALSATALDDGTVGWTVDIPGNWCGWNAEIDGVMMYAVRTAIPIASNFASTAIGQILTSAGYTSKPFGRIGRR